ncbi:MAG: AtpZ/AtpI family protein, partial [Acidobacteriota bacterium]
MADSPDLPPLSEKRLERRKKRREVKEMADVSTIGTVFPMAILIGLFGGQAIGGWFGARSAGALIGLGIGIAAGFYNVYKVIKVAERREREAAGHGAEDS